MSSPSHRLNGSSSCRRCEAGSTLTDSLPRSDMSEGGAWYTSAPVSKPRAGSSSPCGISSLISLPSADGWQERRVGRRGAQRVAALHSPVSRAAAVFSSVTRTHGSFHTTGQSWVVADERALRRHKPTMCRPRRKCVASPHCPCYDGRFAHAPATGLLPCPPTRATLCPAAALAPTSADQRVLLRVEAQVAGDGVGRHQLGRGHEGVRGGVAVVARSEVPVGARSHQVDRLATSCVSGATNSGCCLIPASSSWLAHSRRNCLMGQRCVNICC